MILIKLIKARKNLRHRCKELFTDEKMAERVYGYLCEGLDECENQKASDAVKVRHEHWENIYGDEWCCTACGHIISTEGSWEKPWQKYCEECGAKMDGVQNG